jgi:RsiW-degrading membrane proteinase PrsW (M82 family)
MKANMGTLDRAIRIILAIAVGVLYYFGYISGTVAIVLGIIAIAFLLTGIVSFCPLYLPFGISTRKN